MILPVVSETTNDTSDNEVTCAHSDCAGNQDRFPAEAVDIEDCWDGEEKFKDTYHTGCEERRGVS